MPSWRRQRLEVVAVGARLADAGFLSFGDGNISVRLPDGRLLITPAGADKGRLEPGDLMVVGDEDAGSGASVEFGMHRAVYHALPVVRAIIHAHPPGVQCSSAHNRMPDCHLLAEARERLGSVVWVGWRPSGSVELAQAVAAALVHAPAAVLDLHGAVTVGANLAEAIRRLALLERLATMTEAAARP